jgi:hypothetical protein
MNVRGTIEEGFRTRQTDFGCVVLLDSRGFAGVVLGETVASSKLRALEIVIFVIFGVFAREQSIDVFTGINMLALLNRL